MVALPAVIYAACMALTVISGAFRTGRGMSFDTVQTAFGPVQFLMLGTVAFSYAAVGHGKVLLDRFVAVGVVVALWVVLEWADFPWVRSLSFAVTDQKPVFLGHAATGVPRAPGPFDQPHFAGAYLLVVLSVMAYRGIEHHRRSFVAASVVLAGIAGTGTAVIVLGSLVVLGMSLMMGEGSLRVVRRWLLAGVPAAVMACLALVARLPYERPVGQGASAPVSLADRWDIWTSQFLPELGRHGRWLTGYGAGFADGMYPHPESLYIGLLWRGGVVLLASYALFLVCALRVGWVLRRSAQAAALFTILVTFIPLNIVEPYFVDSGSPHALALLLGCVVVAWPAFAHGRPRSEPTVPTS